MAGAAKRRNKAGRQDQATSQQPVELLPPDSTSLYEAQLLGGLDGPSDDRSTSGRPHKFGPSLGYDPARGNVASKFNVPSRLELPAEAYRDSHAVSSVHSNLRVLQTGKAIHFLACLPAWLAKPTPLHYPARNLLIYIPNRPSSTFDFLHPSYTAQYPCQLQQPSSLSYPTQPTIYSQNQSSIQATLLLPTSTPSHLVPYSIFHLISLRLSSLLNL
jgi:hypothetical protein